MHEYILKEKLKYIFIAKKKKNPCSAMFVLSVCVIPPLVGRPNCGFPQPVLNGTIDYSVSENTNKLSNVPWGGIGLVSFICGIERETGGHTQ